MDDNSHQYDLYTETSAISQLLTQSGRPGLIRSKNAESGHGIVSLKTSDYATLADFKNAYLACEQPVLCIAKASEVPEIMMWMRESDDLTLPGEPAALAEWRHARLANAYAERLDPLTQVHRRGQLINSLTQICVAATKPEPVSLILLDIDHLKVLNDQMGVQKGDEVVAKLGHLIRDLCQKTLVARTRGGEFGIVVEDSESVANQIATIIQRRVSSSSWCDQQDITASFGVACVNHACEPSLLLSRADEAPFAAKANGRDRVVCHSEIAKISNRHQEELDVISMENKARVLSERVTSFVTQRSKRIMQSLRREANTDGLTQLFNRRYLDKQLGEEYREAVATSKNLCVALVDLDHFGIVNKRHGWPTGDKVLRSVAETILQNIRSSDWVGRYGGEEICIVMPGTNLDSGAIVCERIRSSIDSTPFESTSGKPVRVTLSIGVVALQPAIDTNVASLIERVSQLTLQAKTGGRNRVQMPV